MALADKYGDVLGLAQQLGVRNGNWKEEGGKIRLASGASSNVNDQVIPIGRTVGGARLS